MYSQLFPWLLTWSDYEEGFDEDDGGKTTMSVQTRNISKLVSCRLVGMTWVFNVALAFVACP
jgi:hypothetical protein